MPTIIDEAILYKDAIVIVLALTSATANYFFFHHKYMEAVSPYSNLTEAVIISVEQNVTTI